MEFSEEKRERIRRRVRAARALAGYANPADLARQPAAKENRLSEAKIRGAESKARDTIPGELDAIADACDLAREFFRLDDLNAALRLGALALSERDAAGAAEAARTLDGQDQQQPGDDESQTA